MHLLFKHLNEVRHMIISDKHIQPIKIKVITKLISFTLFVDIYVC